MDKLAHRIAESAAESERLDEERKKVIAYGLGALLQMLLLLFASLLFGLLFHCMVEALVIFLAVGILKSSAGGAHARTSASCTFISLASISLMALFSRYVVPSAPRYWPIYAAFEALIFAIALITAYRRVPVASSNKPIVRKEKIQRLRRRCFLTLGIFFVLCEVLTLLGNTNPRCINAAISLCMAVLWQTFMLTDAANRLINFFDSSIPAE
jgi:accessory gene regulator B